MGKKSSVTLDRREIFESAKDDRKFLESVFDRIPGMIYVHDLVLDENIYRSWSLKKILGYADSPMLNSGKGIRGLVHEDDMAGFKRASLLLAAAKDNDCVRFKYRMKHKNGKWLWFQSDEYVYERDAAGKPIKCLGYATDLTTTIEQQHQLDQLNRVNQLMLKAAQILSRPDAKYKDSLQRLSREVSLYMNVVCDISILDQKTEVIGPEALYYHDTEVRKIIKGLFATVQVKKGQGLVGKVIESGKELLINEVPEQMQVGPRSVDSRIVPRSLMYIPLKGSNSVLGSLNLTRLVGQDRFSENQVVQMRRLGDYLSLFVENGLLKARQQAEFELREKAEQQVEADKKWAEFKLEISTLLAHVDADLSDILQLFAERVARHFDAVCDVQLLQERTGLIIPAAVFHKNKPVMDKIEALFSAAKFKVGEGMIGKVLATGKELYVKEIPIDLKKKAGQKKVDKAIMPSSFVYVPLVGTERILGCLNVTRLQDQESLSQAELNQIRDLANHASRFIENRILQRKQKKEIERRKKAEQKLERAGRVLERMEAETRAILNTIPIYIAKVSKDYRYWFLNDTYKKMGLDPRTMEGKFIWEVVGKEGFELLRAKFEKALSGELVTYDYNGKMADGEHRYFNVSLAPDYAEDGNVIGFYSCASDITSKVLAEQATKLTQDRLETLTLNSGDAFFFHDSEMNILDVNQVSSEMLGYSRKELLGMKADQIDPKWKLGLYQQYLAGLETNVPQTFDTEVYAKNGTSMPVEVRFVKRLEGDKVYIQSLIRDRTEKREQEQALQRSEERLRLIFENIEDHIATANIDGIIESINTVGQGLVKEEVLGSTIYEFFQEESKVDELKKKFAQLVETGKKFEIENVFHGPDGSAITYLTKYLGIFHEEKFFKALMITRDVTAERDKERAEFNALLRGQEQERKRLGAELHDGIGQILSAIALQVSQIKEEVENSETEKVAGELAQLNQKLQSAIREVRNISHDLMPEVLESFGLVEALNQTSNSLQDRTGIRVKFDHVDMEDSYDPFVEVNLYRITQELLNNIHKHARCKRVFVTIMDHGDSIDLTIEDDGIGFKLNGEFKGIGLSNIYSRVSMLGGRIDVESAENSGTLVNIEIPKKLE